MTTDWPAGCNLKRDENWKKSWDSLGLPAAARATWSLVQPVRVFASREREQKSWCPLQICGEQLEPSIKLEPHNLDIYRRLLLFSHGLSQLAGWLAG